jgi:lysozyme
MTPKVIDLSHYDDITSFQDLITAGIVGVIQNATEGASDVDPTYAERKAEVAATSLQWGVYHFWRPEDSAEAQADNFLAVAKDAPRWALDYEVSGGTPAAIVAVMQAISAGCNGKMMLYGPKEYIEPLIDAATDEEKAFLAQADLWWAEYDVEAPTPSPAVQVVWPTIFLWQYTESGTVGGANGEVDLDSFSGTDQDLTKQWGNA